MHGGPEMIQPFDTGLEFMRMAGQHRGIDRAGRRAADNGERISLTGSNLFNGL